MIDSKGNGTVLILFSWLYNDFGSLVLSLESLKIEMIDFRGTESVLMLSLWLYNDFRSLVLSLESCQI